MEKHQKKEENEVQLSVIKGDKLFNENTPFVINVFSPDSKLLTKKSNADLICIIDISGSMSGSKIELVKQSLIVLIDLMDINDRLAIILFNDEARQLQGLNYLTKETKNLLKSKVNEINATGGTNIFSGLNHAVNLLINDDKNLTKDNRASSLLLLSDGCDNNFNEFELGQKLKDITKGKGLNFTLNTFGYGNDHDPKIMKKLASIRDGSFFYVEKYKKVAEYFGVVLGTCVSVISNKASLVVELLNKNCKIKKLFGGEYLFSHELNPHYFTTTMLHFISGKEFTYVLEFEIEINNVKIGEDLLTVDFIYPDKDNCFCKKSIIYKYTLTDINHHKANQEYIRSQVYSTIDESLKLREKFQNQESQKILENMKNWLIKNDNQNKSLLGDINEALNFISEEINMQKKQDLKDGIKLDTKRHSDQIKSETKKIAIISSKAMESTTKKLSSEKGIVYSNRMQKFYSASSRDMMMSKKDYKFDIPTKSNKKKNCLIF